MSGTVSCQTPEVGLVQPRSGCTPDIHLGSTGFVQHGAEHAACRARGENVIDDSHMAKR